MAAAEESADKRLKRILAAKAAGDTAYLVGSLRDPDNRHLSALFLGELDARGSISDIEVLLSANDPLARANAARALGKLRAREAAPRLLDLAQSDPIGFVRGWATGALGEIGDQSAVPALIDLLGDREWRVRVAAAYALGLVGDETSIPAIRRCLRREGLLHRFRRRAYREALDAIRNRLNQ